MACQSCRQHARLLARSLRPAVSSAPSHRPAAAPTRRLLSHASSQKQQQQQQTVPPVDPAESAALSKQLSQQLASSGITGVLPRGITGQYLLTHQLDTLYKVCSAPAAYTISEDLRKAEEVPKTVDGEELGVAQGPWLEIFNLAPSFSSWSHVTMLHMYLIVARIRCLDRDAARSTQAQFVDNFFFDCERVMHVNHGMTSSALRQRYLKDIFMQWRGLIAAYDEGIAKADDRVLAAAVWRNLFKAREDVDFRHLAAVVAWMRATLRDMEACPIEDVLSRPQTLFRRDPRAMLALVDEPSRGLKELYAAQPGEAATAQA
ncbi:ubiquinol-cytochrome C chaperone-domain-containing protein [Plectosphaerella cucumerina]|uniref:Ubiquinol-cytochrome C chaperone-domain-containing protein n=1 Tax=Plectosphaerella cucumerina TaxID=40658 RepID=A0A8K0T311_9PEZI|nr:ubiquinol-cytochrome C chaperone-domain-containing protein [Plectosphaerella cucumerina]